jgi:AraC family transcriptional regulator of adaptative response/methylated-DNA-[protein]-cysteine methyltransferase
MTLADLDKDPRWAAVLARDPDAGFLYSVRTTGVYCRPSCGSRRPAPRNVAFHLDPAAAEAAGFRPCRRCRPDEAHPGAARAALVAAACRTIDSAESPPRLAELAVSVGLSPHHFHRAFKAATGLTPRAYAAAVRARRLREALPEAESVTAAGYDAGFGASSRLYEASGGVLGMSPAAYRKGGERTSIRFAVGPSSLGQVLVARTDRGLCAIQLGEDADALATELRARFPRADIAGPDPELAAELEAVIGAVEDPRRSVPLPLDVQGTAFQQRVWAALSAVPPGRTVTYSELAARAGFPGAARAAGAACGANRLAVVIPCHRAVGRSGALTGYAWGLERKQALLNREASDDREHQKST